VVDEDKLVYKFNEAKNTAGGLPNNVQASGWTYILGVDTGWEDDNAFVLSAFHDNLPELYIVRTFNKNKMTFNQVVEKINEFMSHPTEMPSKVIIDGANKQGVESMRVRSRIPFEYADKRDKATFIELLNGDFATGRVKINAECRELISELKALIWKTDGGIIVQPKKEEPRLPNHLCDAMLYAWRNGYHYHWSKLEKPLVKYSNEWYKKQADDQWDREREHLEKIDGVNDYAWPKDDGGGFGGPY
jgi:phage terminase large subunit